MTMWKQDVMGADGGLLYLAQAHKPFPVKSVALLFSRFEEARSCVS